MMLNKSLTSIQSKRRPELLWRTSCLRKFMRNNNLGVTSIIYITTTASPHQMVWIMSIRQPVVQRIRAKVLDYPTRILSVLDGLTQFLDYAPIFLMIAAVNSEVVAEPGKRNRCYSMDIVTEQPSRVRTSHVGGANFTAVDDIESCAGNAVRKVIEPMSP